MLSNLGRLFLTATALSPILLVYGAAIFFEKRTWAIVLAVVAGLLVAVCDLLLRHMRRHGTAERIDVEAIKAKTPDNSFWSLYLLPILLGNKVTANTLAIAVFVGIMALVFFRSDIYHVNPLMAMPGYHFYEVTTTSKVTYLLVTTRSRCDLGSLVYRRLSQRLLMEVPANLTNPGKKGM